MQQLAESVSKAHNEQVEIIKSKTALLDQAEDRAEKLRSRVDRLQARLEEERTSLDGAISRSAHETVLATNAAAQARDGRPP